MSAELRLYSRWQNSAGERVRIALNLKCLDYVYVPIGSLAPEEYARLNPQGLLPALEVEGHVIPQSSAILEYLEETFPDRPLLPRSPTARAQARAFAALISSELHPLTVKRVRRYLQQTPSFGEDNIAKWVEHWHHTALSSIERALEMRKNSNKFCFSDEPGWADLHLVPQLSNARRFNIDLTRYPLASDIDMRCSEIEAFVKARPEQQVDSPTDQANVGQF